MRRVKAYIVDVLSSSLTGKDKQTIIKDTDKDRLMSAGEASASVIFLIK